jgi:hypothetical protein
LQEPEPLSYLAEKNHTNYDIPLEVLFFLTLQLHFFATIFIAQKQSDWDPVLTLQGLD